MLITVVGLPDGARVRVEGREVSGPSFTSERSDRQVPVEVTAPGHAPWRRSISALAADTVQVRMRQIVVVESPAEVRRPDAGVQPPPPADAGRR
ncbi:MAG: hypothetical protein QME96_18600, partial [Myxococcota bacterium]|nr:hypothetical protein [Myxococcota bacterium]